MNKFTKFFLKYVLGYALFLLIVFLLSLAKPKAATYEYQIFGGVNDSEFGIEANNSRISTEDKFIFFGKTMNNYMYVDLCTTGNKPSSWVYDAKAGSLSVSTQVLKVNKRCVVSGYEADVYRFTFFVADVSDIGQDRLGLTFTTRLFNETSYYTYMRILSVFGSDTLSYADIEAGQNEAIQQQQKEANDIMKRVEEEQKKTNDLLTDDTAPDLDIDSMVGWLPAGPVDSILNLPLTFFNSLTTNLSKTCKPINVPLPYLDRNYELPCIKHLFAKFGNFSTIWNLYVGTFVSVLILYSYLLRLYKYIDETLKFRDSSDISSWGGV